VCSGGKSVPTAVVDTTFLDVDVKSGKTMILPVVVPGVDGVRDARLQKPFSGDLASGLAVVDLQESGSALLDIRLAVALAGVGEGAAFSVGQVYVPTAVGEGPAQRAWAEGGRREKKARQQGPIPTVTQPTCYKCNFSITICRGATRTAPRAQK
jgi:hypothetical protein